MMQDAGQSVRLLAAIVLAGLLALAATPALAQLKLDGRTIAVDTLTDPSRELGVADLRRPEVAAAFRPASGGSLSRGYARDAVFLRFRLESPQPRSVVLEFGPAFTDEIDVWFGRADVPPGREASGFGHVAAGDNRPVPVSAYSSLSDARVIRIGPAAPVEVFVRVAATNSALSLDLRLYSPRDYVLWSIVAPLRDGLWLGGMAVLVVIQLVFHRVDRGSYFLILAIATVMAMLTYVGTLGLSRFFLFRDGGIGNDLFTAMISWLSVAASALSTARILEMRNGAPRLYAIFLAGAAGGVAAAIAALFGANLVVGPIMQMLILALAALSIWRAIAIANDGSAGARLRAMAYVALGSGLALTMVYRLGLLPLAPYTAQAYAAGLLVYTILLTTSLGVRLRAAEGLNNRLREGALAQARGARDDAERLVASRTTELQTARMRAEEALAAELAGKAAQLRFMEVVSHQYRTPLAAIRSHVDNIGFSLPADDSGNQRRVERVRRGVARLVEVIEVNLARSRAQGVAFRPNLAPVSAVSITERAAARARDFLQAEIRMEIAPQVAETLVLADGEMLELALVNLLDNAVKFSVPTGGAPVTLALAQAGDRVVFSVEDRGIGIPAGERSRVLRLGERASNAAQVEGTGHGLWLVSRIAAVHEGRLDIDAAEGGGTKVMLHLPLHPGQT